MSNETASKPKSDVDAAFEQIRGYVPTASRAFAGLALTCDHETIGAFSLLVPDVDTAQRLWNQIFGTDYPYLEMDPKKLQAIAIFERSKVVQTKGE